MVLIINILIQIGLLDQAILTDTAGFMMLISLLINMVISGIVFKKNITPLWFLPKNLKRVAKCSTEEAILIFGILSFYLDVHVAFALVIECIYFLMKKYIVLVDTILVHIRLLIDKIRRK